MRHAIILALCAGIVISTGCSVNPVTGTQDFVLMSEDSEIALGRETHAQIIEQYGNYENNQLQRYVQRIGERLAGTSHRSNLVYRFTVLDSADVNAFALPGGYIYITRGLLAYLNSEAELAAVLGHEIGHVTARHSVRQYTAQQAASIGATIGAILLPELGTEAARGAINLLGNSLLSGYGREHELEADRLGAEYLARNDYPAAAMIDVIRTLKDQETFETENAKAEGREPRVYHGLFATHPDNDTRLQEAVAAAAKFARGENLPSNRQTFLYEIEGLTFGEGSRQGVVKGSHFYHQNLDIELAFPDGWQIKNKPDRLLAYAPGGTALLQMTVEDINRKLSPQQFISQRLKLSQVRDGEPIDVNGLRAYTVTGLTGSAWGQRRARVAVVYAENRAYIFAGVSKDDDKLGNYDRRFREAVLSFRSPMSAAARGQSDELKLRLLHNQSGTVRIGSLAAESPLGSAAAGQLRLLNGLYPDREPSPDQWLKVVR